MSVVSIAQIKMFNNNVSLYGLTLHIFVRCVNNVGGKEILCTSSGFKQTEKAKKSWALIYNQHSQICISFKQAL